MAEALILEPKDYATDQEVRWCPGCGDYSILKAVHRALADTGADPANTVFVSGIGCSSRLPYYVETYGFHTIHGRAPAIATGVKLANPQLDVWVITGDGDGLSIGGNHLLHALRRNVNLNILLFNNEIYGLTKGQYSPTSRPGTRSPTSPGGSFDTPVIPGVFAIGAGATFIARAVDIDQKGLPQILAAGHAHEGTAFIEILQNCIVYNEDVWESVSSKKTAADSQVVCVHGQPLLYGKDLKKGLRLNTKSLTLEAVTIGEDGVTKDQILVHDETSTAMAHLLLGMRAPLPMAMGIIHRRPGEAFDSIYRKRKPEGRRQRVKALLRSSNVLDRRPAANS
ncbi:MAG: 2-oxoacid:ferredoxin oxidoreductase subunit beta [Gammaproteobacteria bacterium]|nr:2-oxoacid:ferredoxin oxidoreductase subunit beta [Gammaproteobacteria bacterium]